MYIIGYALSLVGLVFALALTLANHEMANSYTLQADFLAQGFNAYDYSYDRFMAQYGSKVNSTYPASNADLFPAYGFAPVAPSGATWTFGVGANQGAPLPYACLTMSVDTRAKLEAVKARAYEAGASLIQGTTCTARVASAGNLSNLNLPATVSAVKYYAGKAAVTQGVN